jgi:hypothetical protein
MEIKLHEISIREIVDGYTNNDEEGVVGYSGKLNIRPKYQREFVYNAEKRNAVIETIWKDFPLNVMYWAKNADGTFEVLDGQQRTISFCEFKKGNFSINFDNNPFYLHTLESSMPNKAEAFLNYKVMVYFCEGTDDEKLDWFKIINIAGEKLTDQELRNAVYTGSWLSDAKLHFSKTNCPAYLIAKDYVKGSAIRQEILETALDWISQGKIKEYMAAHQQDSNAGELWQYFQDVIHWLESRFIIKRSEMKGLPWGDYYNRFKDKPLNASDLEEEIKQLMQDDDITKKSGIYEYVLDRQERHLNIRAFTDNMRREAYERQNGICPRCEGENTTKRWELSEMEADHITPWHEGGKTSAENCQMLCRECNRRKSGK